jgi:2,3-bisphosphoglycerate-independent phosphoglycerate mutase
MMSGRPLVLTILDGWGYSPAIEGNAIAAARKPTYDALLRDYPHTLVHTSGPFVGLPDGQMGNSEVGHLNIGAGRVIHMDVTRIDLMIASGDFFKDPTLLAAMHHSRGRRLHLMGLLSDGGVHSMNTHLYALLKMAKREGVKDVAIHCFMDGRDTPPESGAEFLEALQREIRSIGLGRIATVVGRYYAMDRDKRWERIERAKSAMVQVPGKRCRPGRRGGALHTARMVIEPVTIVDARNEPVGTIREGDACVFFNYRADRGREMTQALIEANLKLHFTTMTQYDKGLAVPFVLTREHPNNILANVMGAEHWKNLRVMKPKSTLTSLTFQRQQREALSGRRREMVASPKVATSI